MCSLLDIQFIIDDLPDSIPFLGPNSSLESKKLRVHNAEHVDRFRAYMMRIYLVYLFTLLILSCTRQFSLPHGIMAGATPRAGIQTYYQLAMELFFEKCSRQGRWLRYYSE